MESKIRFKVSFLTLISIIALLAVFFIFVLQPLMISLFRQLLVFIGRSPGTFGDWLSFFSQTFSIIISVLIAVYVLVAQIRHNRDIEESRILQRETSVLIYFQQILISSMPILKLLKDRIYVNEKTIRSFSREKLDACTDDEKKAFLAVSKTLQITWWGLAPVRDDYDKLQLIAEPLLQQALSWILEFLLITNDISKSTKQEDQGEVGFAPIRILVAKNYLESGFFERFQFNVALSMVDSKIEENEKILLEHKSITANSKPSSKLIKGTSLEK